MRGGKRGGKVSEGRRGRQRRVGETAIKSVSAGEKAARTAISENAAAICICCQTALKHILLFNEKGGDEKENSSALKKNNNTDVLAETDVGEEITFTFASSSSSFYCLKERRSELKHFPTNRPRSRLLLKPFCMGGYGCEVRVFGSVGLSPTSCAPRPGGKALAKTG